MVLLVLGSRSGRNESEGFKYLNIAKIDRLSDPRDRKQTAPGAQNLAQLQSC